MLTEIDTAGAGARGIYGRHEGDADLEIFASGTDIVTANNSSDGIFGHHTGAGDIKIEFHSGTIEAGSDGSITDQNFSSRGIEALHGGVGGITIDASDVTIITKDEWASGVRAHIEDVVRNNLQSGSIHNIFIKLRDVNIMTRGESAAGVTGWHELNMDNTQPGSSGEIRIDVRGGMIESNSFGVAGNNQNDGNIFIDVRDLTVRTSGFADYAIYAKQEEDATVSSLSQVGSIDIYAEDVTVETSGDSAHGILAWNEAVIGDINVKAVDTTITTTNTFGMGVYALSDTLDISENETLRSRGDVNIDLRDTIIKTTSTALYQDRLTLSAGVYGRHEGDGDIDIDIRGGSIETAGTFSYGIYGRHEGDGNLTIDTHDGHAITTTGPNGHGIVVYHFGTNDSRRMDVTIRGPVDARGMGAYGVQVGAISDGAPERVAAIGIDGYRQQTVTVHDSLRGNAAGIFLAGGGRVTIGPGGSIDADSGIAILATGDTPGADPVNDPAIKPKLRVDMNLNGRRVAEAIGDNWIINDGGETTIAVNGVVLHDGATGVTSQRAANGVWDVWMREEGVLVEDRTDPDPANWIISTAATGVVADRDFSARDFTESEARCPQGQTGFPNCMVPPPPEITQMTEMPEEPEMLMFVEEYAPRAAVYEALPGALFRLNARGTSEENFARPDSPLWIRFSGGGGSFEPDRATVDAEYDFDRLSAEAGLNVPLGENLTGIASVRAVRGDADVDAPNGGGEIEADGIGVALGISYKGADAYYARGRFSFTRYDLDLSSDTRGSLKKGLDVRSHVLDFEVGQRMATYGKVDLTPRLWVRYSRIDVDDFIDMVGSKVSVGDETRLTGGFGVVVEGQHGVGNGELFLRGSADLEQTFSGSTTSTDVSGERLSSEAAETRLLLGLGGTYRRGSFMARAGVFAGGPGSDDEFYSGYIRFGWEY